MLIIGTDNCLLVTDNCETVKVRFFIKCYASILFYFLNLIKY
jgi:hypothetical protein